jgi:putative salt-induced outer membrane protein YdiY
MSITNGLTRVAGFTAALILAQSLQADVLHLSSGDRLTGEIDSVVGGKVVLKTDFAGTINVGLETVEHMESEKVFELRRKGESDVSGQFVVSAGQQQFKPEDGAAASLDLATVGSARENNLALTSLTSDWSTRFDAGISVASGNTDTESQNYSFESILSRSRSDHRLAGTFYQQKDDGEKTKDKMDLGYRYREKIDGVKEDNPALRWGLDYNRFIWAKKLELFYTHSTLFIPQNNRGTVYNGSTGLRMSITDMITANLRVDVAHETDPAPDRDKTDLTYVIGIGLVF